MKLYCNSKNYYSPVDVSLVAITAAVASNVTAAAGKISAIERINKYNQKLILL